MALRLRVFLGMYQDEKDRGVAEIKYIMGMSVRNNWLVIVPAAGLGSCDSLVLHIFHRRTWCTRASIVHGVCEFQEAA